ncbi:MAG TPA: ribokinase [Candidatus Aminicenantes bacterium]|nr:ribokinase [Candidatus Aminicenantes bacterium]HRY66072.1 ribokinase [Candidatus Aminicenantes bacterium]HRZ72879.1 ribokinase [Candidatus Aminicenantes bacterium]
MTRVVVVGSSNTDMVLRVPRIPRPGETVLGGGFSMAAGGKGANQAVAAARAGGRVTFVARVGDDIFGERALAGFEADGIDARFVLRTPGAASGVALIDVDDRGENSISVASGANALLSAADVGRAAGAFAEADVVLVQLESPIEAVGAAVRAAGETGAPVVLNPAPARPLDETLLARVSVLTPNETEAELLSGIAVRDEGGVRDAAARLRALGPRIVVVTRGERGLYASGPGFDGFLPAFRVEAVDTTAAGDVFNGALAVALGEKRPLAEALRFAQAAAAISVTRPGAQPSAPARAEIEAFLER